MPPLKVPMEVVDAETGKVVEKRTADFQIVPPTDPQACRQCGRRHAADAPHDGQSLHYQYIFYADHDRWPTWKDAVAHCPPETREAWEAESRRLGHWPADPDVRAPAN